MTRPPPCWQGMRCSPRPLKVAASAPFGPEVQARAVRRAGRRRRRWAAWCCGQELDLKYEAQDATGGPASAGAPAQDRRADRGGPPDGSGRSRRRRRGPGRRSSTYGYGLGLVFQIVDDVLDVTSHPAKSWASPSAATPSSGKTTFVTLYGADRAPWTMRKKVNDQACWPALQGVWRAGTVPAHHWPRSCWNGQK